MTRSFVVLSFVVSYIQLLYQQVEPFVYLFELHGSATQKKQVTGYSTECAAATQTQSISQVRKRCKTRKAALKEPSRSTSEKYNIRDRSKESH